MLNLAQKDKGYAQTNKGSNKGKAKDKEGTATVGAMDSGHHHHRLLWRVFSVCCHAFPSSSIHTAIVELVLTSTTPSRNTNKDHDNVLSILLKQAVNGWHSGSLAREAAKLLLTWCIAKITGNTLCSTTKQQLPQQPQQESIVKEIKKKVSLAFAALSPSERRVT